MAMLVINQRVASQFFTISFLRVGVPVWRSNWFEFYTFLRVLNGAVLSQAGTITILKNMSSSMGRIIRLSHILWKKNMFETTNQIHIRIWIGLADPENRPHVIPAWHVEPFRSAPVRCGSIFMDRGHRKWGNDVWWCLASKNWDSNQKLHFANNSSKGGHQKTLIKSLASWIIVFPSFGWCLPSFLGSNQWNVCKKHQNINHIPSGHLTVCFWK